ncbi:FMN-binding protein [Liquorilactobacillus mali]|uniref:FMN-binding protein n=1 Tax=Liquorilactobacillus mali TaxID=1618 RepID=UPI00264FDD02|nr:FMN-binding protein [Liquorilactobacillus mali]MDN7146515.1 FMN-binding protein [Liquorilactobacillus mali]
MFKKIMIFFLSVAIIIAIILDGYFVFFKQSNNNTKSVGVTSSTSSNSSSTGSTLIKQQKYKNGTYLGKSSQTSWGPVQIKIKIIQGKINQIIVLRFPDTHGHSIEINHQVLPIYKKEALRSQSSSIQQVSGATETWKGFTTSLQSALNQAR